MKPKIFTMDFKLRPWTIDDLDDLVRFEKTLIKNGVYEDELIYAIRR